MFKSAPLELILEDYSLSLRARICSRWSAKFPSSSEFSVPAVANIIVVSKSPMIPDTVLAAFIHAWVPREPACNAAKTCDTFSTGGSSGATASDFAALTISTTPSKTPRPACKIGSCALRPSADIRAGIEINSGLEAY
ncbi:hypothetical protein Bhyg_05552 [Pseudolycoriella hygida]|uniref:Uncharacterized protein n=1 Tax=Pseudolycoriella hygida TaxID=35572 RepID=A0A9Q0MZW5_9DIPT|nr:hypothetical protein Bhyg_05552 [Pseudolycoriella hygida]